MDKEGILIEGSLPSTSVLPLQAGRFSVMAKPIGATCNLDCSYCYYLDKNRLYPKTHDFRMNERVLETYIREYIAIHEGSEISFSWQGGEPTMCGMDFFQKVLELQDRHCPDGKTVSNALQTNGTLLDQGWAAFLREHNFLVGLSIDGPKSIHDRYRMNRKGEPTFEAVLGALRLLRDEGVAFNTLSVVHRGNARHGRKVYRFLKGQGVHFMQFIPLVERSCEDGSLASPPSLDKLPLTMDMAPWSVPPLAYGNFMCEVFDEWVGNDVGNIFIQLFDAQLANWTDQPPELCVYAKTCGQGLALEHNGDLYSCDHYVYPDYRLGNILEHPVGELAQMQDQQRFGNSKQESLPRYCRDCEHLFVCNGGCPKHRFVCTPDGEPGLNYLCPSYKRYFAHTAPYMRIMSGLLNDGRPPALVSRMLRNRKPAGRAKSFSRGGP